MPEDLRLRDAELRRRQRGRNIAMLIVLLALVALLYAIGIRRVIAARRAAKDGRGGRWAIKRPATA